LQFEEDRKNFKERQEIIPTKDSVAPTFRDRDELGNQRRPNIGGEDDDEVHANNNNNQVNNNIPGTGHVLNPGNDDQ